ncbi:MAG TPA: DUF1570 domain-containing protein [Thermoanaerobaculia bacterium]|nr:DUF1570 domain-containing protein [Thermoanaerobaculia bacterium]
MPRRLFGALALLVTLTQPLWSAHDPRRAVRDRWIEVQADDFRIFSNASEPVTIAIAERLQKMRAAMASISDMAVRSPLPTRIYVFRGDADFEPFRLSAFGESSRKMNGIFVAHPEGNYILVNAGATRQYERIVHHELIHYFLNNTIPDAPAWFSEGMAEFYSTFSVSGKKAYVGAPIEEHVRLLKRERMLPMLDLVTRGVETEEFVSGVKQSVFYAQSWLFVHYLLVDGSSGARQLNAFLERMKKGTPPAENFVLSFGRSAEDFERVLRNYLRQRVLISLVLPTEELPVAERPTPRTVSVEEMLYQFGDLVLHIAPESPVEARLYLEEALRIEPGHAASIAMLALLDEKENRLTDARRRYEAAVALQPSDPLPWLLFAEHLLRQQKAIPFPVRQTHREVVMSQELLERALALDSASARAWCELGKSHLYHAGDLARGIEALERCRSLEPSRDDVLYQLVILHARQGERKKAEELVQLIGGIAGEEASTAALETIFKVESNRASSLWAEGSHEEAASLFELVADQSRDPDLQRTARSQAMFLRVQLRRNQEIDRFNAAAVHANESRFAEALRALDDLLMAAEQTDIRERAETLRREVTAVIEKAKK